MSNENAPTNRTTPLDSCAMARTDQRTESGHSQHSNKSTTAMAPGIEAARQRILKAGWSISDRLGCGGLCYEHSRYPHTYFMFAAAVRMQDMWEGKR